MTRNQHLLSPWSVLAGIALLLSSANLIAQADKAPSDEQLRYQQAMQAYHSGHYHRAFAELVNLAESGYAEAQFRLGVMLHQGIGAPQNFRQARRWYRAAADAGHAGAQNNLGVIYRDGDGVRTNRVQAYMWFSLAASQMNAKARNSQQELALDMSDADILQAQQLTAEYMAKLWKRTRAQQARSKPAAPGFAVQLGLFTKAGNIERIRLRLADLGLPLDNQGVEINGQHYQRLRVGPFDTETRAEQIAKRMDKLFRLKSAVTPVNP